MYVSNPLGLCKSLFCVYNKWVVCSVIQMHKLVSVGSLFVVKLMFEACVAGPPAATITSSAMECSVGIGKSKFT